MGFMVKVFFCIAATAVPIAFCAAPVENPSTPGLIRQGFFISCDSWVDFRVGYEGDFVADGRMRQFDQGHGRVDCYEQDTNSATVTWNILDRLDLYAIFGSSKTEADWRFRNVAAGTVTRIDMETNRDFLWGAGARAILWEWCNIFLGLGGRYSSCSYDPAWLTANGLAQSVSDAHFYWREWQINFDISYKISLFTPYIGTKYSNARARLKNFSIPISESLTGSNQFKNRIPVGFYVGCSLSNGKYFMLNVEGRVIDEEAVTISGDFRF